MRHEAKAEEKQFWSEWFWREMTIGTVWNTVLCLVMSTGSYKYKDSIITSIVL